MAPRVTWIMPVLNGMPFLPESLASMAAQSYTSWEVLIWDNGSTDGSLEELQKWVPAQIPGELVKGNPQPLGQCLALLVERSRTEYCARIDADDINQPDRLAKQVEFMDSHPDVAVVGSQYEVIGESGAETGFRTSFPTDHEGILHRMLWENAICHPAALFRRDKVLALGNYSDMKPVEDYDLWFRALESSQLANIDEPLIKYRMHSASVTGALGEEMKKHLEECFVKHVPKLYGLSEEETRLLVRREHPHVVQLFKKIDAYLQKTRGGGSRWRHKSFVDTVRALIPAQDKRSWLEMLLLTGQYGEAAAGLGRNIARKFRKGTE